MYLQFWPLGSLCILLEVAKHPSQYFPAGTLWNCLDELHATSEPLMPGFVVFHVLADTCNGLLIRFALPFFGSDNKSLGDFACAGIMNLNNSTVGHERVN